MNHSYHPQSKSPPHQNLAKQNHQNTYIHTHKKKNKATPKKNHHHRLQSRPSFPVPVPRPETTVARWSPRGFVRVLIRRCCPRPRWARAVPVELAPPDGGQLRCVPWPGQMAEKRTKQKGGQIAKFEENQWKSMLRKEISSIQKLSFTSLRLIESILICGTCAPLRRKKKQRINKPCGHVSNSEIPIPPVFFGSLEDASLAFARCWAISAFVSLGAAACRMRSRRLNKGSTQTNSSGRGSIAMT